jgi:hypothetical protein
MAETATKRLWETGEWEMAPTSVGAGVARMGRWLRRLPAAWFGGWLAYARAAGGEPEHLVGPNPWSDRMRRKP